jgi:hypothetical protein
MNVPGRAIDFLQANGKFDSKQFEEAVKEVIVEIGKKPLEELLQDPDPRCKVSVPLHSTSSLCYCTDMLSLPDL